MLNSIVKFAKSEDGAITVDWVVLTAGVAFLGLAVIYMIGSTTTSQSEGIGSFIGAREVVTEF